MIAIDTNIIIYLYLNSEKRSLIESIAQLDSDWIVPLLWRSEFRNVLVNYIRVEQLTLENAQKIMEIASERMLGSEFSVSSHEVLALAAQSGRTAYDCEFIALAINKSIPLVTHDRRLREGFPEVAISPEDFVQQRGRHRR